MLSGVLRSARAVAANIHIMRTFARTERALLPAGAGGSIKGLLQRVEAHELELGEHAAQLNDLYAGMRVLNMGRKAQRRDR